MAERGTYGYEREHRQAGEGEHNREQLELVLATEHGFGAKQDVAEGERRREKGHRCTWLCRAETACALLAGDAKVKERLRHHLKRLARAYGLRCWKAWWTDADTDKLVDEGLEAVRRAASRYDGVRCFGPLALRYFYNEARNYHRRHIAGYDSARTEADRHRRALWATLEGAGASGQEYQEELVAVRASSGKGSWEAANHNPALDVVLWRVARDGQLSAAAHKASTDWLARARDLRAALAKHQAAPLGGPLAAQLVAPAVGVRTAGRRTDGEAQACLLAALPDALAAAGDTIPATARQQLEAILRRPERARAGASGAPGGAVKALQTFVAVHKKEPWVQALLALAKRALAPDTAHAA